MADHRRKSFTLTLAAALTVLPFKAASGGVTGATPEAETVESGRFVFTASNRFNGRNMDIHLMKSDSVSGGVYWTQTYETGSNEQVRAMAKDSKGNLILAGSVGPNDKESQFLIVSYSPYGSVRWVQTYSLGPDASLILAVTDKKDNLYVAGIFHNGTSYSLWTAKYNAQGSRLWDRVHDSGYNDYPHNLYIAPRGDIILTFESTQPLTSGQYVVTKTIMYNAQGQKR